MANLWDQDNLEHFKGHSKPVFWEDGRLWANSLTDSNSICLAGMVISMQSIEQKCLVQIQSMQPKMDCRPKNSHLSGLHELSLKLGFQGAASVCHVSVLIRWLLYCRLPCHLLEILGRVQRVEAEYKRKHDVYPDANYVAKKLRISVDKVKMVKQVRTIFLSHHSVPQFKTILL